MNEVCTDDRFEIIDRAKRDLLECTNIDTSPDEMKVINNILFRCWQMGWLDKYKSKDDGLYAELFAVKNGMKYSAKIISMSKMSTTLVNGLMDGIENMYK